MGSSYGKPDRPSAEKNENLRIIALSALIENQEALLKWFPAQSLLSHQRPVELRKGMVRESFTLTIFKVIILINQIRISPRLKKHSEQQKHLIDIQLLLVQAIL